MRLKIRRTDYAFLTLFFPLFSLVFLFPATGFSAEEVALSWSTYIGGASNEHGEAIKAMAIDSSGCIYLTGDTYSSDFPTTSGVYADELAGLNDAFITKLNPTGTALEYSTFLGGWDVDSGYGLAIDSSGCAFVAGFTESADFPVITGVVQEDHGGNNDVFVSRLNADGSDLYYSTYVGGTGDDYCFALAIDSANNVYVCGYTESLGYPTTSGALKEEYSGGLFDAFISRLNSTGTELSYSALLGGESADFGYGIAVDSAGAVYVTGRTDSPPTGTYPFPVTSGAYDTEFNISGLYDAFVAKLNPAGAGADDLIYSTYLGGEGREYGRGIALDSTGAVCVVGYTDSTDDYPTVNGYSSSNSGGRDAVVSKLNPAGSALEYSTYLGGELNERGRGITLDSTGVVYMVGETYSSEEDSPPFPVTSGAFDETYNGGLDVFVAKIDPAQSGANSLRYCTYLGGGEQDCGESIGIGAPGRAYVTGFTYSSDFPTTAGSYDQGHNVGYDVFVARLVELAQNQAPTATIVTPADDPAIVSVDELITFEGSGSDPENDPLTFYWDLGDGTILSGEVVTHSYHNAGTYTVTLTVSDSLETGTDTVTIVVQEWGTVYYVDGTSGSDSNDGLTRLTAWKTIYHAGQTLEAGDTVYIMSGTYDLDGPDENGTIVPLNTGEPGKYITFAGDENATVVIDGGSSRYVAFSLDGSHSYIRIVGLRIRDNTPGGIRIASSHHIEVRDCTISNSTNSALRVSSAHDIILAGLVLNASKLGIELTPSGLVNVENVQIIDCVTHSMHLGGTSDGVTVKQFISGDDTYICENIYLTGCEAYDVTDDGFDLFGLHITAEHCVAHDVTCYTDEDGHGFKTYALDLPVDEGRYHAEFIRCLTYNVNREGFKLSSLPGDPYSSSGNTKKMRMLNCTSAGDDYGVLVVSDDLHPMDVEIKNCLVSTKDLDPSDGDDSRALHITGDPVIWGEGPLAVPDFSGYFYPDFDYNLWYSRDENGALLEPIDFLATLFTDTEINDDTYFSETGCGEHSISYDPAFVDENGLDFHLDENAPSPCLDAGVDVGLPYAGSAPDLGFFESGTVTVSSPADYLKAGVNWISIPVLPINQGAYSVFAGLNSPNTVYHKLYRYQPDIGGFIGYPTYQSDSSQFGNITPGTACELMLAQDNLPIEVEGVEVKTTQVLTISGSGRRSFCFGCPFNEFITWDMCWIDNGGMKVPLADAVGRGWIHSLIEHFDPVTKGWETVDTENDELAPWQVYRLQALTSTPLELIISYPRAISGKVTLAYPVWSQGTASIDYQVREPGLPPADPLYSGTLAVSMTPGAWAASGYFTIVDVAEGTYDIALKHANHIADMAEEVVVSGGDVSGLDLTLWAGDADGDDEFFTTVYPDDPYGDNDVELADYYTLFYQYHGGLPLTTGYNADFDGNGKIELWDYYGLFYGYHNAANPGNWWYP